MLNERASMVDGDGEADGDGDEQGPLWGAATGLTWSEARGGAGHLTRSAHVTAPRVHKYRQIFRHARGDELYLSLVLVLAFRSRASSLYMVKCR